MKIAWIAILVLLSLPLTACKLYVVRQAIHQNNLYNSRKPVAEVIKDQSAKDIYVKKLGFVQELLQYADESGLDTKNTYRYFVDTEGRPVSYLVQAAEVDRLEFVNWWFPFVGNVPYLGFFSIEERDEKANELRESGYDVNIGDVTAFSGLGWFEDPIYSSMLDRNDTDIAQLFFHELTHRTIWIKDSVVFNENLAEFIAITLTNEYFAKMNRVAELERYAKRNEDKTTFKLWLKDLKKELEKIYIEYHEKEDNSLNSRVEMLEKKKEIFGLYTEGGKKPKFIYADYVKGRVWNNATILGSSLYIPDMERFEEAYDCVSPKEIKEFLKQLSVYAEEEDDPFNILKRMCHE